MKLSETQKRILYTFRRTGKATRSDMRRESIRYAPALKALMKRGFIIELENDEYALTQTGGTLMPQVLDEGAIPE